MNKLFTTGQIAKHCGVSFRTVIRWIKRGELKAHQLPGRGDHRISTEDLLDFLHRFGMPVPNNLHPGTKRILVVDDDVHTARSIERTLRRAGYETRSARDGFQAGLLVGTWRPALVTLDLKMPGLDGVQVLRFIRGSQPIQHTPVIVISALERSHHLHAIAAGADSSIAKPFDDKTLLEQVTCLINRSGGSEAYTHSAPQNDSSPSTR